MTSRKPKTKKPAPPKRAITFDKFVRRLELPDQHPNGLPCRPIFQRVPELIPSNAIMQWQTIDHARRLVSIRLMVLYNFAATKELLAASMQRWLEAVCESVEVSLSGKGPDAACRLRAKMAGKAPNGLSGVTYVFREPSKIEALFNACHFVADHLRIAP